MYNHIFNPELSFVPQQSPKQLFLFTVQPVNENRGEVEMHKAAWNNNLG